MKPALVLAGLSARMMVEAAARDGYAAIALDAFGDADTRRRAGAWADIGTPGALRIDAGRLLAALHRYAGQEDVLGWVAGSSLEGQPLVLEAGARILPLIGTPAAAVRRVRDPQAFFAFLAARGIAHPPVRFAPPRATGWLSKDADGSGGWHIGPSDIDAAMPAVPQRRYFQRPAAGTPMSALFVAHDRRATVLGFNELIVRRMGRHPFVYAGAVGPLPLAPPVAEALAGVVQALAAGFGLAGLCSLDFMLDGSRFAVLEVNPRPSGSMALYGHAAPMQAHVQACLHGRAPDVPRATRVRGTEIVFARAPLRLGPAGCALLACAGDVHDVPAASAMFAEGDPVCSISVDGADATSVHACLAARRESLLDQLESVDECSGARLRA